MLRGYVRILGAESELEGQIADLYEAEPRLESVVIDRSARRQAVPPELDRLLEELRDGDVLVVRRLGALGSSVSTVVKVGALLASRHAHLRVVEPPIDTRTNAEGILETFMMLANLQRDLGRLTAYSPDAASADGTSRRPGRPTRLGPEQIERARALRDSGVSISHIALEIGVPRSTVYGYLRRT